MTSIPIGAPMPQGMVSQVEKNSRLRMSADQGLANRAHGVGYGIDYREVKAVGIVQAVDWPYREREAVKPVWTPDRVNNVVYRPVDGASSDRTAPIENDEIKWLFEEQEQGRTRRDKQAQDQFIEDMDLAGIGGIGQGPFPPPPEPGEDAEVLEYEPEPEPEPAAPPPRPSGVNRRQCPRFKFHQPELA